MPTSPTKFRDDLLSAMHDLLWRQWSSLGAGLTETTSQPEEHLIDPEALLLVTTAFGRRETRLFDEALDWLTHFGSLINLQRLKNLHASSNLGDARVLHATAAFVQRHGKLPKWGSLAKAGAEKTEITPKPFFILDGAVPEHWGKTDPDFLSHGWLRGLPRLRGLSMAPAPDKIANTLLTLRALIGVSSRCEIILSLLTRPSASVAELARLTGYAAQSIQSVLGEMVISGKVRTDGELSTTRLDKQVRGKSKRYFLHRPDWCLVLPAESSPRWLPWASLFAVVQKMVDYLSANLEDNPLLLAIQVRRILEVHAAGLTEDGMAYRLGYRPEMTGEALVSMVAECLPALLREL